MSERPSTCSLCGGSLERLRLDAQGVEEPVALCSVRCVELWSDLRANLARMLPRRAPQKPSAWLVATQDG